MSINPASVDSARKSAAPHVFALPRSLSSFVGRLHDLDALDGFLHEDGTRLITLTGSGGVGKARPALESAARVAPDFPEGVWFVDLSPLADPALVVPTLARSLGVTTTRRHPTQPQPHT